MFCTKNKRINYLDNQKYIFNRRMPVIEKYCSVRQFLSGRLGRGNNYLVIKKMNLNILLPQPTIVE